MRLVFNRCGGRAMAGNIFLDQGYEALHEESSQHMLNYLVIGLGGFAGA